MKVLNPNKIPSRIILTKKMVVENSDEENDLLEQQVKDHNKRFDDNLLFFKTKKMTFTYNFDEPSIVAPRSAIPEKFKPVLRR